MRLNSDQNPDFPDLLTVSPPPPPASPLRPPPPPFTLNPTLTLTHTHTHTLALMYTRTAWPTAANANFLLDGQGGVPLLRLSASSWLRHSLRNPAIISFFTDHHYY